MFRCRMSGQLSRQLIVAAAISLFAAAALSAQKKQLPETPVDLNVANIKELEQLPGVGPTTAKAIIDFRTKSGRFHRVNDLLVIRGISEAKLKKMRPYVTVGPPPAVAATPPATKKPVLPAAHPAIAASSTKPHAASTSPLAPQPPAATAPH